jgi:hypothetical protein
VLPLLAYGHDLYVSLQIIPEKSYCLLLLLIHILWLFVFSKLYMGWCSMLMADPDVSCEKHNF